MRKSVFFIVGVLLLLGTRVLSDNVPDGVTVLQDIEYAKVAGRSLKLDLYLPETTETKPPLIVWLHGGGWKVGDKKKVMGSILRLTGEGYAVASVNYRLKDLSIYLRQIHDCKGAVRWLRAHADEYGYDPQRFAVSGVSAGGHLALIIGVTAGVPDLEGTVGGNTDQSSAVSAIVEFCGPAIMDKFWKEYGSFIMKPEALQQASPSSYVTSDDPPLLILHSKDDGLVPFEQSVEFDALYKQAGLSSTLIALEKGGHGNPSFSDDERYRIIKNFLDDVLKK